MPATNRFKVRAEDFIMYCSKPKIAISAKYPLAPPWPTEAYKVAITNKIAKNKYSIFRSKTKNLQPSFTNTERGSLFLKNRNLFGLFLQMAPFQFVPKIETREA